MKIPIYYSKILRQYHNIYHSYTVRGQKGSFDALFTPKTDTFKRTILNTAYIKTLSIS